jgi:hypothetical protein
MLRLTTRRLPHAGLSPTASVHPARRARTLSTPAGLLAHGRPPQREASGHLPRLLAATCGNGISGQARTAYSCGGSRGITPHSRTPASGMYLTHNAKQGKLGDMGAKQRGGRGMLGAGGRERMELLPQAASSTTVAIFTAPLLQAAHTNPPPVLSSKSTQRPALKVCYTHSRAPEMGQVPGR